MSRHGAQVHWGALGVMWLRTLGRAVRKGRGGVGLGMWVLFLFGVVGGRGGRQTHRSCGLGVAKG
eukprot:2945201-Alexandrium_andersonii.AAC.1